MKRFFSIVSALAVVFSVASCNKESQSPSNDVTVHITGSFDGSKTGVIVNGDGTYSPYWLQGDEIGVYFDELSDGTPVTLKNSADDLDTADFDGEVSGATLKPDGTIYAFYPSSAYATSNSSVVRVNVPAIQKPADIDTFDPAADILIGKPSAYSSEESYVVSAVEFARVLSLLRVNLKAAGDCPAGLELTSFKMEVAEGVVLTGRAALSFSEAAKLANPITEWTVKNNSVEARYTEDFHPVIGGTKNTVFLMVNPTTVPAASAVSFTLLAEKDGKKYEITKTIGSLAGNLVFPQGDVANLNLTIAGENVRELETETRIYVENFDAANPKDGKEQLAPAATGAKGTGVTDALTYKYSTANTNIRNNSTNGHGNSNPYLWISGADQSLIVSNIAVDSETALKFTCQTWTTQSTAVVTIQYKESTSKDWLNAGTVNASMSTKNTEQYVLFTIDDKYTSIDLKILGSAGSLVVDDIVLEKFVDTRETLANPTNVSASLDSSVPNKINVSWNTVEHANKYEVVLSASEEEDVVLYPETNSVSATGLAYEKEYTIKVKAVTTDIENYIDSDYVNAPSTVTTGSKPAGVATWDETAFADLAEGDQVVIVGTSGGNTYAMSNNNGTSSAPTAVSINVAGIALAADPVETLIWYVGVSEGNKIFYSDEDNTKWLYCTATNNGVRVGTNSANVFALDATSGYLKHVGTSRFIGIYNSADWRCYTSATATNITGQSFKFYVCSNKETKYSVSVGEVEGGTLSADPKKAAEGAIVTLSSEAKEGWQFNNDWSVDDGNVTVTDGTFTMPARNVNVTGSFSKKDLAITKASATNGSFVVKVNSSEVSTAQVGDEVTLVANPDPNYELKSWTVYKTGDESTKVTVTNNAFTMPAYPVTVAVEFKDASSGPSYGDPVTATITFGTNNVKINAASVTGDDTQSNTWTITTVGTTSFTTNTAYYQVGSSSKPATSITFTTTLPKNAKVTAMSAKFGGFSGTAGTVTLKVGETTLGTGSLNAGNDVTVSVSNKEEVGKVLTVTLTGIAKGVKVYNISATYQLEN